LKTLNRLSLAVFIFLVHLNCQSENPASPVVTPTPGPPSDVTPLKIQTFQTGNLTVYTIDKYDTRIVKIPRISAYLYLRMPTGLPEKVALDSNYSAVVNSSYFDITPNGCLHAGYLKINDSVYVPMKGDKQLQRLFAYSSRLNTAAYFDTTEMAKTTGYDLVVQTGPQIIRKSRIDTASIASSINGPYPHPRTAFASVNGKDLYIIVALKDVTLIDLGAMLLRSGIFTEGLDVINFDGGPSTALYVKGHPEFSNTPNKFLPMLLCVK
jgi:exopolysaccharide biosynthesis protein